MLREKKRISIVLPAHNEQEVLPALHRELRKHLDGLPYDFEFIFVDDGSRDKTVATIARLRESDPRIKCIILSKNFGHQAALTAGTHAATGDAVVHMDSDMQHPPALLPTLIKHWEAGAEIVETQRIESAGKSMKHLLSAGFYWVFARLSNVQVHRGGSDFRLLDRKCVDALNSLPDVHLFIRGMTQWIGYDRIVIPYEPQARAGGTPSYTLKKSLSLAINGILAFSDLPLRLALIFGASIVGLCTVYFLVGVVLYFTTSVVVPGWLSLVAIIMLMGGANLLCTGVLSLYVWRIFDQTRQRPVYLVKGSLGYDKPRGRFRRAPQSRLPHPAPIAVEHDLDIGHEIGQEVGHEVGREPGQKLPHDDVA
jgi:dolichol-phosphate mannosyltransferase